MGTKRHRYNLLPVTGSRHGPIPSERVQSHGQLELPTHALNGLHPAADYHRRRTLSGSR